MRSKSIKGIMADGFRPTLAIAFISIKQDRKRICEILHSNGIDIIGATTSGEFIDGYQSEGAAAILLLDLHQDYYTILFEHVGDRNLEAVATQMGHTALQKFKHPAFILCSTSISVTGEFIEGETLIRSIEKVVGPKVAIFGGMAGDDRTFTGTYVFTHESTSDSGIVALVLDEDKVSLQGMAISGWKPLGISRTVTKSEGRWLYTIDEQPALEMYLKYLGKETTPDEDKYKIFDSLGVHYPFQVEREIGEPAMVSPMMINQEANALMCEAIIPTGSKLRFSMPPDFDIVDKVVEKAKELKMESGMNADALLIFSCAGRLSAMGPLVNLENQGLFEIWKVPMAGFYTYGEYGRAINGRQEFHSTTCCWVALKEK